MNELAKKAYKIAQLRGIKEDTIQALKHLSGEVIEATESYTRFVYSPLEQEDSFPHEMADIIINALSICAAENIDIEQAVKEKMEINEKRVVVNNETN